MMEPSDIRAGLALAIGGLLCLTAWVRHDALEARNRWGPLWAAFVLLTLGLGTLAYLLSARNSPKPLLRGIALWMAWTLFVGSGSYAVALAARSRRQEASVVIRTEEGSPGPLTPNPSWGAFNRAFPNSPPPAPGAPPPQKP